MEEWLKIIGSLAGIAALLWRGIDEFGAFLRLSLETEHQDSDWLLVKTSIENKGVRPTKITNALILICPENQSPVVSANILLLSSGKQSIVYTK